MTPFTRRNLLKGAALAALAPALVRAQAAPKPTAVVLINLVGGYNALFGSPQAFIPAGTFGVTASNVRALPNNLYVDDVTYGQNLPAVALSHLATVGMNHHLSSHTPAQMAEWIGPSGRSNALMLAKSMGGGGTASLPCVVVGGGTPVGAHPDEAGVSLQRASDLAPTLDLFGVGATAGAMPTRSAARYGMLAAQAQSGARLTRNTYSLKSAREAYQGAAGVLAGTPPASLDFASLSAAYGVTGTAVSSFTHQMMGAELMIRLGTKVVIAMNVGWDTHGDINGTTVRTRMNTIIMPGLKTFLSRMMAATSGYDVTVGIFGDFARSLPGSDHASCMAGTVIGPRLRNGSTGNVDAQVAMASTPGPAGFWSLLAAASGVSTAQNPFGANPHASLVT